MIIDSHCHLDYDPLNENLDEVISRATAGGVNLLLTISTEDKSFNKIETIIKKYPQVYGSYGIHPHEAGKHQFVDKNYILNNGLGTFL